MKKGSISKNYFSYKDDMSIRYSNNNFIIAIKDEEFPERNIIPLFYVENGQVSDILEAEMDKIVIVPNSKMDLPLSRFSLNQLIKISFGTIIDNERHLINYNVPKCKTFDSHLYPIEKGDLVEIFEGEVDESKSRVKIYDEYLHSVLLDVHLVNNDPIFIQSHDNIIGPFEIIEKDLEGYFVVQKNLWKTFGEYKITEDAYIEFEVNDILRKIFIPSFNKIELIKSLEFKADKELLNEFKILISNNSTEINVEEISKLINLISKVSNIKSVDNFINNNKRIKQLLSNTSETLDSNKELGEFIPEIKSIQDEIEKLKSDEYEIKNSLEKLTEKKENIQSDFEEKLAEIEKIKIELNNLNKTKEEELKKIQSDLNDEINRLNELKTNLDESIKIETELKSKELQELNEEISVLKTESSDLKYTVDELKLENQRVQRDAQVELINLFKNKKYFDFLSGRDLSEFENSHSKKFIDCSIENKINDYNSLKENIINILNKNGRSFETHFIDNLLLSIHQNTLTIFAGLPGTGKTSLGRILTRILSPKNRICEISVNRGWTSQKDFIGFQNPISNKFHSASTGMYELLSQLNDEITNNTYHKSPLAYVLLDEANLSPIEHYWSTFYNLTDSIATENNYLTISLGNNLNVQNANNLRFIATINYDQTTENLSPRVIDRANIIQIPHVNFSVNELTNYEVENIELTFEKCREIFNLMDFESEMINFELGDDLKNVFSKIKRTFNELRLPISPRVEIAIKRYCSSAKFIMKETSRPLDYCVAQRLLPMINLQGDKAKNSLETLMKIFEENDLTKSKSILSKILDVGNEDSIYEGNYNYFMTLSHA